MRTDHNKRGLEIQKRRQVRRFWNGLALIFIFGAVLVVVAKCFG